MKLPRFLIPTLFGALLGLAGAPAHAAVAVAVGDDNYTYTVTGYADLDEAKAVALKKCALEANNCRLSVWSMNAGAVALAKGKGGMFAQLAATPAAARDAAMAGCRKSYKGCQFSALYWEPGGPWAAWAYAQDEKGSLVGNYFVTESGSEAGAKKAAIEGCEAQQNAATKRSCTVRTQRGAWSLASATSTSHTMVYPGPSREAAIAAALSNCRQESPEPGSCTLKNVFTNPGEQAQPTSFAKVFAGSVLAKERRAAARPAQVVRTEAVRQLTCKNSCVNGSCVRTFPDGRQERWQAPRVFDPFSNDWKWDTNSCGS